MQHNKWKTQCIMHTNTRRVNQAVNLLSGNFSFPTPWLMSRYEEGIRNNLARYQNNPGNVLYKLMHFCTSRNSKNMLN